MRIYVKKQILELTATLKEANDEIKKYMSSEKWNIVRELLAQCQEVAIAIGNQIEESEGEGLQVISNIEAYCELLYQVSLQESKDDIQANYDKLNSTVEEIKSKIQDEVKEKLEVVFLPYKASMWTALESIWKAADEDPECDAKVMPLPYYDLDSYQNKIAVKYEAEKFPEYVPITSINKYKIETHKPDMIFIHNPYDGFNTLTRIPEEFYSSNLKKHTSKLVYSPYGMMGYINPNSENLMYHTPGIMNADRIAVQSKRTKEIYEAEGVPGEKILDLGSPKVDAIVNIMKMPAVMPDIWREKLQGRKVFLLNTHLGYFIKGYVYAQNHPESNLGNYAIKHHKTFLEHLLNKEDCALIWRPHPLMKDMLKSRGLVECVEFVEQMEAQIAASNNAVMDTFEDYRTSFMVSDALITSYSSIINEYMITGKPIYIYQNKLNEINSKNSPINYLNAYYKQQPGETEPKLEKFIDMVLKGEDPQYEARMNDVRAAFVNLEGTIGENIYKELKHEVLNK